MTQQLRITGVVTKRARTATDPTGRAWLLVEMEQGRAGGVACRVRRSYGRGHEAQYAATQAASRMRRGAEITVYAAACAIETKRNRPQLVLDDAEFIELSSRPTHYATAEKDDA